MATLPLDNGLRHDMRERRMAATADAGPATRHHPCRRAHRAAECTRMDQ
ncbi:hypothetical protein [Herbaspirillum sp. alder98]|nr:hypothetical protein [Herbaspirillum sp. alder98]MCA1323666.1 hypothetical protein [Herbaspirillum sp. alder98]